MIPARCRQKHHDPDETKVLSSTRDSRFFLQLATRTVASRFGRFHSAAGQLPMSLVAIVNQQVSPVAVSNRHEYVRERLSQSERGLIAPLERQQLIALPVLDDHHAQSPANDTAVQRRAGEGAKRPTRPSDCIGGAARNVAGKG